MITLFTSENLVRNEDGSVNVDGSHDLFNTIVSKYIAQVELEDKAIAGAVGAVFDTYRGARMNTPFIVGQALVKLGVTPENSKILTERVQDYLRKNTDQAAIREKTKKGVEGKILVPAEPKRTRMFGMGKKVGMCRWADVPETNDNDD